MKLKLIIAFAFLLNAHFSMSQSISNEKLLHFSFDGVNDTHDLIKGVEVNFIKDEPWSDFYSDTSIYGVENSSIYLERTWIEIPDHGLSLDNDSSISISFWINSPYGSEMHDFFQWNSILLEHINSFMLVPKGNIDFWPRGAVTLHFVQVFNKGSYKLYINNDLEHSVSEGIDFKISDESLKIGSDYSNYSIDELIVFKGALNNEQVNWLYNENNPILNNPNTDALSPSINLKVENNVLLFSETVDEVIVYQMDGTILSKGNDLKEVKLIENSNLMIVSYVFRGKKYFKKI